jgi:hypothetical protein
VCCYCAGGLGVVRALTRNPPSSRCSQVRGPSCARFFASELHPKATSRVFVLRNGFRNWSRRYGSDPRLTENLPLSSVPAPSASGSDAE